MSADLIVASPAKAAASTPGGLAAGAAADAGADVVVGPAAAFAADGLVVPLAVRAAVAELEAVAAIAR